MENRPIKIDELQIGDEVIVRGLDLNYMKIIRPPKSEIKTYQPWQSTTKQTFIHWKSAKCKRMNGTIFENTPKNDKEVYFDFEYKTIWLVKRKII